MASRWRCVVAQVDGFCARCNDGLMAVAIALTIIASLTLAFRTAQALQVPERFEISATT
jgi:hypothetical protein